MTAFVAGIALITFVLGVLLGAHADDHEWLQVPTVVVCLLSTVAGFILFGYGLARVLA